MIATLIFILTFLFFVFSIVTTIYFLFQGQRNQAKRGIVILFGGLLCYGVVLFGFSLTSKNKYLPLNQDKCFDDWCASVVRITKESSDTDNTYWVTLKISNQARGRDQKPDHPAVYVVDDRNNKYLQSETKKLEYEKQHGQQRSITSKIEAQSSYETTIAFVLPKERKGYVVITEGGFPTPLIIGDEGSFLHKKSMTPLAAPSP